MATDINELMDSVYNSGETSVTKEKVHILRMFLVKAFPDVSTRTLSVAASFLTLYCCLLTEGKRISFEGKELDANEINKLFESYIQTSMNELGSMEKLYDFYGSAVVVAMYVYKYTEGFTDTGSIFDKTRAGDKDDRMADALSGKEIH